MDTNEFEVWMEQRRALKTLKFLKPGRLTKSHATGSAMPTVVDQQSDRKGEVRRGPLIKALTRRLSEWRAGSLLDVQGQIKSVIARFAQRDPSTVAWLSQVDEKGMVKPIVVQESTRPSRNQVARNAPGIVPRVAGTGVSYMTGDIRNDPYYTPVFDDIASEQAVAIDVPQCGSKKPSRYVVNLESSRFAQYYPASVDLLRQYAEVELKPLLRELEALSNSGWCWNPRRHGWGLREFLSTLLQQVKELIAVDGVNNLHLTVWFVDQEDFIVTPLASTGFTHGVRFRESLSFADAGLVGKLATADEWKIAHWHQRDERTSLVHPADREDMGVRSSRLIVTPESTMLLGEVAGQQREAKFRIVVQVVALAPESEAVLPVDGELRQIGECVFDQVLGYISLYPQLAGDKVRQAIHESGSFVEQRKAVAKGIENVLRVAAVTLYARPWQDEVNLHVIAATAPLKRANGMTLAPDSDSRPWLSLLRSAHTARDHDSYAGSLASRPGADLRRNSFRHSGDRMVLEGFPPKPSADYSESLSHTESADPRFLGYSLPNPQQDRNSTAVVLAVRPVDRAPFKPWDSAALMEMLKAATPVIRSWRDWAAIRFEESQRVVEETIREHAWILDVYALSVDRGKIPFSKGAGNLCEAAQSEILQAMLAERLARVEAKPRRRQDPIPRAGSLAALSREVAAQSYERAWRTLLGDGNFWSPQAQAAVLMEARGDDKSLMHPVAFFHQRLNVSPRIGAHNDPRRLRLPDNLDWCQFLSDGKPQEFRTAKATIVRIPFLAWIGQHAARGALTLDLPAEEIPAGANDLRMDLLLLARRLAAAWTVSDSPILHGQFVSKKTRIEVRDNLCRHLKAQDVDIRLGSQEALAETSGKKWDTPMIDFKRSGQGEATLMPDPDAQLYGIQEHKADDGYWLRVPLRFGMDLVGDIVVHWDCGESRSYSQMQRSLWVRDILAAWYLWSWSWTSRGHGNHDDAWVYVDVWEDSCIWKTKPIFPEKTSHAEGRGFNQSGARSGQLHTTTRSPRTR